MVLLYKNNGLTEYS